MRTTTVTTTASVLDYLRNGKSETTSIVEQVVINGLTHTTIRTIKK